MLRKKSKEAELRRLPEPELKRIRLDDLKVAAYQRETKPSKVRKIVKNFEPNIVGIALVSYRDGVYWCIDAQHRIDALKEMGYTEILCNVLTGLDYRTECKYFNMLNTGRTQLTANQVFHADVEGSEPYALELVAMFRRYRFDYNKNASSKDDNVIGAVSKFVSMRSDYGMGMVERVLRILRSAWLGTKGSLASPIITGLATFLNENPHVDEAVLIKVLERVVPDILIAEANAFVKLNMLRPNRADSACYHIAKRIEQLYEDEIGKKHRGRPRKAAV